MPDAVEQVKFVGENRSQKYTSRPLERDLYGSLQCLPAGLVGDTAFGEEKRRDKWLTEHSRMDSTSDRGCVGMSAVVWAPSVVSKVLGPVVNVKTQLPTRPVSKSQW